MNHLIESKKLISAAFKNLIYKISLQITYTLVQKDKATTKKTQKFGLIHFFLSKIHIFINVFSLIIMVQNETLMLNLRIWETDFLDFLTSLIIACLSLGLSFSGQPGIFLGVLFLFFLCNYSLHTLICWFSWWFLIENAHIFQKHWSFLSHNL